MKQLSIQIIIEIPFLYKISITKVRMHGDWIMIDKSNIFLDQHG